MNTCGPEKWIHIIKYDTNSYGRFKSFYPTAGEILSDLHTDMNETFPSASSSFMWLTNVEYQNVPAVNV